MKYLFKLPDFEGGFFYKSIENGEVLTKDNEFVVCDIQPINVVERGTQLKEGEVIDVAENVAILKGHGKLKAFKKSLINERIFEQGRLEYELPADYLVAGTFETPAGKVFCEGQPQVIRKALTQPDKIIHKNDKEYFYSQIGNNDLIVEVEKPIFRTKYVKSIHSVKREAKLKKTIMYKAFGTSIKVPEVKTDKPGSDLHSEGEQRANHKYIERKLNPNRKSSKDKYIYLYELSQGKKVWKDAEGNEVKEQHTEDTGEQNLNFQINSHVVHNGRIAKVKDASDNFLWIEHENKKIVQIDKNEYLEELTTQQGLKVGDSLSRPDGSFAKVKHVTDNIIMLEKQDGTFEYIRKKRPITSYQAGKKNKGLSLPSINDKKISSSQTVLQGYNNEDEFYLNNYEYEDDPNYQMFAQASLEGGYGKQNDLRFNKYVKLGDMTYSVSRFFDPSNNLVDIQVNGTSDYRLQYENNFYVIQDITEEGFAVEDNEGDLFFITYKEYQADNERANRADERKTFNFKPEYTPEELARFSSKRQSRFVVSRKKLEEQFVSQARQKEIDAENEAISQRNKDILNSKEFTDSSKQLNERGYERQSNPFIFKKKVEVEGMKFELTKRYEKDSNSWTPEIEGHFKEVEIDGVKKPIVDMDNEGVSYIGKNGSEETISFKELKQKNGKGIFTKLGGKAVLGKPANIYLPDGSKRSAQFAIVELDDILASHNEETFEPTQGFPIDERGNTVNDRNYQQDKNAQNLVREFAQKYDARNINDGEKADSAITISNDFVVLSGNNRTMSAKLAVKQFPEKWKEYQKTLQEKAKGLGFTEEDLKQFKNPFFVRIDNDFSGQYSKEEFAKYNEQEGKSKTAEQNSATFGEILRRNTGAQRMLTSLVEDAESLSHIYRNPNKLNELKDVLMKTGIVLPHTLPQYFEMRIGSNISITPAGKGLVNQLMLGMVFDEDTLYNVRKGGMNEMSENLVGNVGKIAKNHSLNKDYTLRESINEAINLESSFLDKKENFKSFEDYLSQPAMFGDGHTKEAIAINLLAKKGKKYLGHFLNKYNSSAEEAQGGSMFGDDITKDEIIDSLVNSDNPFMNLDSDLEDEREKGLFTEKEKKLIKYGTVKKSIFGRLLKSIRKSIEGFNEKHPRDEKGRFSQKNYLETEYKKFCENVVGEYKTPVGIINVKPEDFVKVYGVDSIGKSRFKKLLDNNSVDWNYISSNQQNRGEETVKIIKQLLEKPTRISENASSNIQGDYVFILENNARTYYLAISKEEALKTAGIFAKKYTHEKIEGDQVYPQKENPLQKAMGLTSELPNRSGSDSRTSKLCISGFVVKSKNGETFNITLFGKSVDTSKLSLQPSKKNPSVRRWQAQRIPDKIRGYKDINKNTNIADMKSNKSPHTPGDKIKEWAKTADLYLAKQESAIDIKEIVYSFITNVGEPDTKEIGNLNKFLRQHKNGYVTLYHGTSAKHNIQEQGLRKTTNKTKRSYQSQPGFVYLSIYPSMAETFGKMSYPQEKTATYKVMVRIKDLLPDSDQLRNKRLFGNIEIGNSLAESLIYGNGARVKRDIQPYELTEIEPTK